MSEKILKLFLSEFVTIRLHCPKCKAVVELATDNLDKQLDVWACPLCRHGFTAAGEPNYLSDLVRAVRAMTSPRTLVNVEFVIPDKS